MRLGQARLGLGSASGGCQALVLSTAGGYSTVGVAGAGVAGLGAAAYVGNDLDPLANWFFMRGQGGGSASGGPTIRNSYLAGDNHPVTGVPFDENGFPDFSGVATQTVEIEQTGVRVLDEAAANEAAGLSETPTGFTWHHNQNGTTMELVPTAIHAATGHTGGVAFIKGG